MPIFVSIKENPRHVLRRYEGAITLQDLDEAFFRTANLPDFDPTLPQLNDLRLATLALSAKELEFFFATISKRDAYHNGKAAIVVNAQVARVLEESFKLLSQISLGLKLFSDIDRAKEYLFSGPSGN